MYDSSFCSYIGFISFILQMLARISNMCQEMCLVGKEE
jgi:hypothetical protein